MKKLTYKMRSYTKYVMDISLKRTYRIWQQKINIKKWQKENVWSSLVSEFSVNE